MALTTASLCRLDGESVQPGSRNVPSPSPSTVHLSRSPRARLRSLVSQSRVTAVTSRPPGQEGPLRPPGTYLGHPSPLLPFLGTVEGSPESHVTTQRHQKGAAQAPVGHSPLRPRASPPLGPAPAHRWPAVCPAALSSTWLHPSHRLRPTPTRPCRAAQVCCPPHTHGKHSRGGRRSPGPRSPAQSPSASSSPAVLSTPRAHGSLASAPLASDATTAPALPGLHPRVSRVPRSTSACPRDTLPGCPRGI